MVNKKGTNYNDRLCGTSRNDKLLGLGGNDYLLGYRGDDLLYGDEGDDTLSGGSGDDRLTGGKGYDKLLGYYGNDLLYGDEGDDIIYGGRGNDKLYGGSGNDYLNGNIGNDKIYGESGNDTLYGDSGNDKIYGDYGRDTLKGGRDKDTLYGGNGNDYLDGGDGNDILYGENLNDTTISKDSEEDLILFNSGFEEVTDVFEGWHIHANPESAVVVNAPGGKGGHAVKMSINRTDDFSDVINGRPRAELARVPDDYLYAGGDYYLNFKTYLPNDFQFDSNENREGLMQIHQSNGLGVSPLFLFGLDGDKYFTFVEPPFQPQKFDFWGSASDDRGKWINWSLHYKASTDNNGLYELFKNGKSVSSFEGSNSYHNDGAYMKIGLYKWSWTSLDINNRTVYYDDVSIVASGNNGKDNDTYYFEMGYDTDTIVDIRGKNDVIVFGSGFFNYNISLNKKENDLEITFKNSSNDKLIIKDYWTVGTIERLEFQDGYSISSSDINYLIEEMSQVKSGSDYSVNDGYSDQFSDNTNLISAFVPE